jgi:cobaltochelatase CobN
VAEVGLLLACAGCCCGHPERGGPKPAPRALKAALRRAHRRSGLGDRVRLAFTDCLGPCSEANVVFLYLHGKPLWLRRVNAPEVVETLLDHVRATLDGAARPLPPTLAARAFRWVGGGPGPEPPVADGLL